MTLDLKTACLRIARAGIKLAQEGDIAGGQALVKTADALMQGYDRDQIMDAYFAPQLHDKVASVIDHIASTPSDVAQVVTMQKKAEAYDALLFRQQQAQGAQQKQAHAQEQQYWNNVQQKAAAFDQLMAQQQKQAAGKKKHR